MAELIFEKSQEGQRAYSLPKSISGYAASLLPSHLLRRASLDLPEVSELDLTRHFVGLSRKNVGIDNQLIPLGSCTMKFNPRVCEECAFLPGFSKAHPLAPNHLVQEHLEVISELQARLCALCGMDEGTVVPCAGAGGEFVGVQMIAAYHKKNGDSHRTEILVPDSAHGTNPATASMAGFKAVTVRSAPHGDLDLAHLKELLSERTAGLMLTNPNTLGLFSPSIQEIASLVHASGALLYYDGANLNPLLEVARPGDMGFDVMHLNLHKTFSTPHGGGGPGSGPVLCKKKLAPFLPIPRVARKGEAYELVSDAPDSIGHISAFYGNFSVYLRAYAYILLHGRYGLRKIAEGSVLNANYLKAMIDAMLTVPYRGYCMHEFVVQADRFLEKGIRALDIAKRLLDFGVYAPTIYFPLIVKECMLIEPTESESKRTLDHFIEMITAVLDECERAPELVKTAPLTMPVKRLDEVAAAKNPRLRYRQCGEKL